MDPLVVDSKDTKSNIPVFSEPVSVEEFRAAYETFQCVCFKGLQSPRRRHPKKKRGNRVDYDEEQRDNASNKIKSNSKKRKRKEERKQQKEQQQSVLVDEDNAILESIQGAFLSATSKDQESWCVENDGGVGSCSSSIPSIKSGSSPSEFLSTTSKLQGYCSFILQDKDNGAITNLTKNVAPYPTIPLSISSSSMATTSGSEEVNDDQVAHPGITTTNPYWIFVGRNTTFSDRSNENMKGRSEHTDNIQHDGTFHYQLAGTKLWKIRPTEELVKQMQKKTQIAGGNSTASSFKPSYSLLQHPGDIIVINTRLWWHHTELPPQNDNTGVSVSYARDIYLDGNTPPTDLPEESMSNKEGAWAMGFIEKGTLMYTDDPSLPMMQRTTNKSEANCTLVELDESDGHDTKWALEALRDIQESEFFVLVSTKKSE